MNQTVLTGLLDKKKSTFYLRNTPALRKNKRKKKL